MKVVKPSQELIGQPTYRAIGSALWTHLPILYSIYTILTSCIMAMQYFLPSRPQLLLSAGFPLFWVLLYVYAAATSDSKQCSSHRAWVIAGSISASVVIILFLLSRFLFPVVTNNLVSAVTDYFPEAIVSQTGVLTDAEGNRLRDVNGIELTEGTLVTMTDGRVLRLEGSVLVDAAQKSKLIAFYEIMNVVWLILLMLHCRRFRGWHGVIRFFAAALLYGFILESGGVLSHFFTENDYHVYFPFFAAPMVTMLGWPMVFYCVSHTWDVLAKHWIKLKNINSFFAALFIAMIAVSWDLNVDPVATGLGLWTWNARLPAWFFGVPLVNFTSWFSAVFAFGVGYTVITRSTVSDKRKTAAMFAVIPLLLLAAAVINFGICGIAEGFGGPSWTVMMQFWN